MANSGSPSPAQRKDIAFDFDDRVLDDRDEPSRQGRPILAGPFDGCGQFERLIVLAGDLLCGLYVNRRDPLSLSGIELSAEGPRAVKRVEIERSRSE